MQSFKLKFIFSLLFLKFILGYFAQKAGETKFVSTARKAKVQQAYLNLALTYSREIYLDLTKRFIIKTII